MLWIALHSAGASALCKGDPIQNIVEYEGTLGDKYRGVFAETDPRKQFTGPLQCEVITGSWQKIGATDKLPFFLSMATMFAGDLHHLYIDASSFARLSAATSPGP